MNPQNILYLDDFILLREATICLDETCLVLTKNGLIFVKELKPETLILTRDHGYQPIIGNYLTKAPTQICLLRNNLLITGGHYLLYNGSPIKAKHHPKKTIIMYNKKYVHSLVTEKSEWISVNGHYVKTDSIAYWNKYVDFKKIKINELLAIKK